MRMLIATHRNTRGSMTSSFHVGAHCAEWCQHTAPARSNHDSQGELRDSAKFVASTVHITCSNAVQQSFKAAAGGGAQQAIQPGHRNSILPSDGPVHGILQAHREARGQEVPRRTMQRLDRGRSVVHSRPVWGWWVPRVIWVGGGLVRVQ